MIRFALNEIDEISGGEHALERDTVRIDRFFTRLAFDTVRLKVVIQFFRLHWSSPDAFGKTLQMRSDHFQPGVVWRQHAIASRLFRLGYQWPFPLDPIEKHRRKDAVPFTIEHLRSVGVQQHGLTAVREDVTAPTGERIAEGGAAPSVHNIGGHHGEMQSRWHLEKHLKLIHLRTVFRCRNVKFNESVNRLLTGRPSDAQVGRLAAGWTDTTSLQAKLIKPAVLWPRPSKPVRGQRSPSSTGEEEVAQWPLDAEPIQCFLLALPAAVTQLRGGLADLTGLARRGRKARSSTMSAAR